MTHVRQLYYLALILAMTVFCSAGRAAQDQSSEQGQGGGQPEQQGPPATPVTVDESRLETVRNQRRVTGEIEAHRHSIVASQEEGLAIEVAFDEGASVKKGNVLARLDAELLTLELNEVKGRLAEAEAMVEVRKAELDQAESDLQSVEDLASRGAAQPKELTDARTTVAANRARHAAARLAVSYFQAQVEILETRIDNMMIRAPFDGIIVEKYTEIGQWVPQGGMIVELIESGLVDAVLDVPETYVNNLEPGLTVEVGISALAEPAKGEVRAIVPRANPRARTYPVKIEIDDREGRIKPGMSVQVWIPTGMLEQAVTVRKDAILRNETSTFLYVARGGQAFPVNVEVRYSAGASRVVVNGPLGPGEPVIIEGNERLYPSAPVQIVDKSISEGTGARSAPSGSGPPTENRTTDQSTG